MKLKNGVLEKLIKDSENYSIGVDYLRLNINNVKSDLITINNNIVNSIDYDNSNYLHITLNGYDLTTQKIKLSNGTGLIYSYSYFGVSIPLFIYIEYNSNTKQLTNSFGKIDFYGSFFRLFEIGVITKYFFGEFLGECEISRLDFRLDLFNYKNNILSPDLINSRINSFYQFYRTGGVINSWKFGNNLNKTIVVRGYDKKLDISKKGKFRLYGDYQNFDRVFRLEWEFLNKFCKGYKFTNLKNLIDLAKNYIGISNNFKGKYLKSYEKLDLSNEFEKTKYCKLMSAYIKNALKNNINVYDFVDIELEKLGLSKKDIKLLRENSLKINNFNLLNK